MAIVMKVQTVTHVLGLYTAYHGGVLNRQQFAHYSAVGSVEKLFCNTSQNVGKSSGEAPLLFRCHFVSLQQSLVLHYVAGQNNTDDVYTVKSVQILDMFILLMI
jgi:hypothetical protein